MNAIATETIHGSSLVAGDTLFGYEILERIGQGAGSVIYAVADPVDNHLYALKHVIRRDDGDLRYFEQLESEFAASKLVNHPNLRKCHELRTERTILRKPTEAALVMELFDGRRLDLALPSSILEKVQIFTGVADALLAMHDAGYIHCDLKPNNILIAHDGSVKLIDLGQACRAGTIKERIQGTPDWISPEQVCRSPVTYRTDVFNFGATLYWALTGKKLTTLYTLRREANSFLCDERITAPSTLNPSIPEALSNLCIECVRNNPSKRPSDFNEVKHRLELTQHTLSDHWKLNADLVRLEDDEADTVPKESWDDSWWK
jgi:eukaryotic-like serine/threonine-protein kinase